MSDCVAIAPELPFRSQIAETLQHASRSMQPAEQVAARELLNTFDKQLKPADGTEPTVETKREIVRKVVDTFVETKGALEAAKEGEAESCSLLLQHVIADNFDTAGTDYATLVKSVAEAVRVGGEAAAEAGRPGKVEIAERILTNSYNFFPAESPLRPAVLLTLITLLGAADDLSALPLTPAILNPALSQWSTSEADKVAFLTQAAGVYEKAGDLARALDLTVLALERAVDGKMAEHALALALAVPNRFDVDDILKVQGARDSLAGHADELVDLFTKVDELAAVDKAAAWAKANGAYVDSLGVAGLDADEVLRKVRLVALTTLAARSATKEISYADLAGALKVDEAEVEAWVIDAIRAGLLQARLSQPQSLVRIISVSSRGTRRFGTDEWKLLEKRLGEWKVAVAEARVTIESAEEVAAQGPITNQRRPQQRRQQGQQEQQEETAQA
ncbi:hypothetical protein CcaverHIS002_0401120 [Cutaneotrichosporon cavernicola]|uniref:PCI domain-containing protein n=1 Tax=Cutaneotrichosporon cavernicola TaxID=279322 RepID=A0AA48QVF3_9TREE|nr:uncharacterized protein CcaverHIS019_0401090 [Cutaneotrichosporon cavernicola]BEI83508.1 hypothetical protein CcaverHIS002_0401120 [Cutaneotrichosporon cavernicola]BEI91289.1 hypothetical protein CcaverHIS019_0401090 [Cutaneotrichosporon cavernicola]BEI99062.1 hypothetical protein CcaverHIS631_0401050 [Cutaneotrichosporon cavernicola]BEJ06836.1 hypothetical protein CcaverHIS641_0401050 [Cutaneotrichosporon cavernicola]